MAHRHEVVLLEVVDSVLEAPGLRLAEDLLGAEVGGLNTLWNLIF